MPVLRIFIGLIYIMLVILSHDAILLQNQRPRSEKLRALDQLETEIAFGILAYQREA